MRHSRRTIAVPLVTALAATGLGVAAVATAPAAGAATAVNNATLRWGVNDETNNAAFAPGTWNLMSAGRVGDPGASTTLKTADSGATWNNGKPAGWTNQTGNVTLEDKQSDGSYAPATFLGTLQNSAGVPSTTSNNVHAETQLVFRKGTGTVDSAANTASISWDGDASVLYYSGLSFFYLSDPQLTVEADGDATITATVDGFGADQVDTSKWKDLDAAQVTLATLTDVDVDDLGFTATPEYRGVAYDAPAGGTAQVRTGADWGSFPQSFVDFQQQTGTGPYFYSTGGSADKRKPTQPLQVLYGPAAPAVSVDRTVVPGTGTTKIIVSGTGFDPSLATGSRPPLAGKPSGVYVAVGKFAPTWRPSQGAPSTARKTTDVRWAVLKDDMAAVGGPERGAIELRPDGSFTAELTLDKAALDGASTDPAAQYGVYTYPGGGATAPSYETATPVSFTTTTLTTSAASYAATHGRTMSVPVTVDGAGADSAPTGTVTLAEGATQLAAAQLSGGTATLSVPAATTPGTHAFTVTYTGEPRFAAAQQHVTVTVAPGTLSAPTPTVAGTARVASVLTARPGTWTTGTALSYQWRRSGSAIGGATGAQYRAVAADAGRPITVTVTGHKANYTMAARTSAARTVAKGVLARATVAISGKARVGKKLTAKTASFGPAPVSLRYQWRAAGKVLKGATTKTLTLKKAYRGKKITVVVTAAKSGYTTVQRTSRATARVAAR